MTYMTMDEARQYVVGGGKATAVVDLIRLIGTYELSVHLQNRKDWIEPERIEQVTLGRIVFVHSYGDWRRGVVTKVGRSRVTVTFTTWGAKQEALKGWHGGNIKVTSKAAQLYELKIERRPELTTEVSAQDAHEKRQRDAVGAVPAFPGADRRDLPAQRPRAGRHGERAHADPGEPGRTATRSTGRTRPWSPRTPSPSSHGGAAKVQIHPPIPDHGVAARVDHLFVLLDAGVQIRREVGGSWRAMGGKLDKLTLVDHDRLQLAIADAMFYGLVMSVGAGARGNLLIPTPVHLALHGSHGDLRSYCGFFPVSYKRIRFSDSTARVTCASCQGALLAARADVENQARRNRERGIVPEATVRIHRGTARYEVLRVEGDQARVVLADTPPDVEAIPRWESVDILHAVQTN